MSIRHLFILLLPTFPAAAQDTFQLAPPLLKYPSVFFDQKTTVELRFQQPGTTIHYTTNGSTPTLESPEYLQPVPLQNTATTLKARSFGPGFYPSETVEATFYQTGLSIKNIQCTPPNERYAGKGPETLTDQQAGNTSIAEKNWLGFQNDTVTIQLTLAQPQKLQKILLHTLENQGAWIFTPQKIEVFYKTKNAEQLISAGTLDPNVLLKQDNAQCRALFIPLKVRKKITELIVRIYPVQSLPDWHPGKGGHAWFFIDEIAVY